MQLHQLPTFLKSLTSVLSKADAAQKAIAKQTFEGETAGGQVKVRMSGTGLLISVDIAQELLEAEDAETIGALVVAASKSASDKKEAFSKSQLATIGSLPFGVKLPGITG